MRRMATALMPVLLMGLVACQGGATSPDQAPAADGKARSAATARIGDAADVGGRRFGEHLRVSLRGFVDPAVPTKAKRRPAEGHRWVGVELNVVNVGGTPYKSPTGKSWVVDEWGRRYPVVREPGEITTGRQLETGALPVGEERGGWLVFEVPFGVRAVRLHCTVGSETRGWQL